MSNADESGKCSQPPIYTPHIDRVCALLETMGYVVDRYSTDLPDGVAGRIDTDVKPPRVSINCASAHEALLTLTHEAGHALGYVRRPMKHSYQRERQAFVLGWRLVEIMGLPVTREDWIEEHRTVIEEDRNAAE